ncbi:hypothetical protein BH11BAC4_BH11BAC4_13860 [soil metagenome]
MAKKNILLVLFACSVLISTAQNIPPGYYSAATGLSCGPLKTALSNIITAGQFTLSYGQLDNNQMPIVDTIRTDDGTGSMIWDIYSNNNTGPEPYFFNSTQTYPGGFCGATTPTIDGTCWNKEHTFPKAWFASAYPAYADLYIVRPTDYRLNAKRVNAPYATVGSPTYQFPTAGTYPVYPMPPNPVLDKLGPSNATAVTIPVAWEPSDAVKGDLARGYFYILTRYENDLAGWVTANNGTGIEKVVDAANPVYPSFNLAYLTMMFNWHIADPVDAKEINRNDLIYTQQNNRNPYIDHPEYVALAWQCTGVIPVTVTDFVAQKNNAAVLLKWYATFETSFKKFEIERSTDAANFNKIGEVEGRNLANYSFDDDNLPNRAIVYYRLKMIDIDGRFTYSKTIAIRLNNNFSNALVYPNPTAGKLTIKLLEELASNSVLQVTDITGRKVKEAHISGGRFSIELDVRALPEGRYFIRIFNSSQLINQSVIILK